jgi:hypothetical protein
MGTHYTPEELGAEVDAEGELIQATAEQLRPADPDWASKPATAQLGDEGDALALDRIELATVELTLRDGRQITMLGEPTETSQLWITPTVDHHDGRWSGNCSLTHKPTGLYLITSDRPSFLPDVATEMAGLDRALASRETCPAATEQAAKKVLATAIHNAYRYDDVHDWTGEL